MSDTALQSDPRISVIIPTFNRAPILRRALEALGDQDLAPDQYEVIVADDGSRDNTAQLVAEVAASSPMRVDYSWETNQGANAARNRAIRRARGELLIIINDDTIPVREFLSRHAALHDAYPQMEVAGLGRMTISPEVPHSIFTDLHLDAWFSQFASRRELDWKGFVTCNLSVKTEMLRRHGMFEEQLRWHEDLELGERLSRHGLRVIYEPEALGFHLHHLKEKDFLGVAEREGKALAEWYVKDPSLGEKMAGIGLHTHAAVQKRVIYRVADAMLNGWSYPYFVQLARSLAYSQPSLSQKLYLKLYQSRKRRATRKRLIELAAKSP